MQVLFKRYIWLPAALTVLLSACSTTQPVPAPDPAAAETPAASVDIMPAGVSDAESDLSPQILFRLLTAEIAGQRGRIDLAVQHYLAAATESGDPAVAERATRIAVYARDDAAALESARLWAELQPHSIEAHQVAAAMYVRVGDTRRAHSHLEQVLALSARSEANTFMLITSLLSKERDKQVALDVMEELVAGRQDKPEALYAYSQLAMLVGELDKALVAANRVRALRPAWADVHILHSSILYRQGNKREAMTNLQEAVEQLPDDATLRDYYARRLVDEKRFADAREQFEILLRKAPANHEAEYALGLLALQLEDLDAAVKHFKHLVKTRQRVNEAGYYLGQIAEQRKQTDTAMQWYQAVSGGQYHTEARIRMALIEARKGEIDRARERLREIEVDSAEGEQRLYLAEGEILREARRYQDAFDLYNVALAKLPDNVAILYARALTAEKIDRIDVTFADLEKIIEQEPNNVQALNAYGYTLVDRSDRVVEGFEFIKRAYKQNAEDPAILDSMGWANYRLGNYAEALKYLRKAFDKMKDAEIAAHLGEVLWVTGDQRGARDIWDEALRETPTHKLLLDVIKRFTK